MANFSGSRYSNGGQIHWFGQTNQNDTFDIILDNRNSSGQYKHDSHHVYGNGGDDIYDFTGFNLLGNYTTGRLDTFDPTRDEIRIEGTAINNLSNLPSQINGVTVEVVEWKGQQWLRMQDGPSKTAIFALEGARLAENTIDDVLKQDRTGAEERHFYSTSKATIDALPVVTYENPMNMVPEDAYDHINLTNRNANTQTYNGTNANELIYANKFSGTGDRGSQVIDGNGGHDVIQARSGNDTVYGGGGNDSIAGGLDADMLYGEGGNDLIYGGTEQDYIFGANGKDKLHGNRDNDVIRGGKHADTVSGGEGEDVFEIKGGDLVDWDTLSGSAAQRNTKLDVIGDFTLGEDVIHFSDNTNVDELGDLKIWKTTISGNVYFTIQVRATNERILVDVPDNTSWSQMHDNDNFIFGDDIMLITDADMYAWGHLNGSVAEKNDQLVVVEDFDVGTDKIRFSDSTEIDDLSDVAMWKTTINGNVYFTIKKHGTNERILVDVEDTVTYSEIYDAGNFIFG